MRDTRIQGLLLPGRISLSMSLECMCDASSSASGIDFMCYSKRVFILGPSHHVYLDGCALSKCKEYQTPIGALPVDVGSEYFLLLSLQILTLLQLSRN